MKGVDVVVGLKATQGSETMGNFFEATVVCVVVDVVGATVVCVVVDVVGTTVVFASDTVGVFSEAIVPELLAADSVVSGLKATQGSDPTIERNEQLARAKKIPRRVGDKK